MSETQRRLIKFLVKCSPNGEKIVSYLLAIQNLTLSIHFEMAEVVKKAII